MDAVLLKKICDGNYIKKDMIDYLDAKQKAGYDAINSFHKYYSLSAVLQMINRYEKGEIDARAIARWAYEYMRIITGDFKSEEYDEQKNAISLKDIIVWEIVDWLDSISFLYIAEQPCDMSGYKSAFKFYDMVYKNMQDWKIFVARQTDAVDILFVNERKKGYTKYSCDLFDDEEVEGAIEEISSMEMEEKIKQFVQRKYQVIDCGRFY